MWRITIALVIAVAASATLAVPPASILREHISDRSLRIGGSSNVATASDTSSNGFSLAFVPLFSLLANFIPRILSRFSGVNANKARSLGIPSQFYENNGKFCNPTHLGQWPDATNCKQFYICQLRSNCSGTVSGNEVSTQPLNGEDGNYVHMDTFSTNCTTMQLFMCQDMFVYNSSTQKCESQINSTIACEHR